MGNWERGIKAPNLTTFLSLCQVLQISADTLMGLTALPNKPQVVVSTPREHSLLKKYRLLDQYGKHTVDVICNLEFNRSNVQQAVSTILCHSNIEAKVVPFAQNKHCERYIPAYVNPSAAGISIPLEGVEFEMILADNSVPSSADFAVRIQGDSMCPFIEDGSLIFVNKDAEISNGDVGIFCVDGAMYCKQFYKDNEGNVQLLSANQNRINSNIYLSSDCGSTFETSGKVIMEDIPFPDYLDI